MFGEFGVESYVFEVLVEDEFEEGFIGEFDRAIFWWLKRGEVECFEVICDGDGFGSVEFLEGFINHVFYGLFGDLCASWHSGVSCQG